MMKKLISDSDCNSWARARRTDPWPDCKFEDDNRVLHWLGDKWFNGGCVVILILACLIAYAVNN